VFLDPIIKLLKSPFEFKNKKKAAFNSLKGGIKGDVNRLKGVGKQYKKAADSAKGLSEKAKEASGSASGAQKKMVKAGLFSKKKKCPSCGEKLHPSWDMCPSCGWSNAPDAQATAAPAPAPAPAPKMKTVALDGGGAANVARSGVGWLVALDGPQTGELFQLSGRSIIGTAADCSVVLKDPSVSGRHAEFTPTATGFRVNDLGSTNGTYVNDKRVTTSDLIDNDNVRFGRVNCKFKSVN
jgi:hypothetical protein